jgi:hypothetical protein
MSDNHNTLKAGAARIDISPPLGTQLAGDIGRLRPVDEIRDPLYAAALVVEDVAGRKFCVLSLDLTVVTKRWVDPIRQGAVSRFGFAPEALMVCATQTHSAVAFGHAFAERDCEHIPEDARWLLGGDDAYHPVAVEQCLQAIGAALQRLEPVQVGAASGIEARSAFNRRFVMRDGTAQTHPSFAEPHIRYTQGPNDPEVGLVCFKNEAGNVIAAMLHYTSHPNHGYPKLYVSADWPGAWCNGVRELLGEQCVPVMLNGCCGNIHHTNHLSRNPQDDHLRMGRELTETTAEILTRLEYKNVSQLDWRYRHVPIAWRSLDEATLASARGKLKEFPQPEWMNEEKTVVSWEWMYAISILDIEKQMQSRPTFDYELQVFRIGEIGFAALPGEPFVEGQLRLKIESPTYPTYVAHMSNIYGGYIPTAGALARGGFETNPSNWSKLGPTALDDIIDNAGEMLRELFVA